MGIYPRPDASTRLFFDEAGIPIIPQRIMMVHRPIAFLRDAYREAVQNESNETLAQLLTSGVAYDGEDLREVIDPLPRSLGACGRRALPCATTCRSFSLSAQTRANAYGRPQWTLAQRRRASSRTFGSSGGSQLMACTSPQSNRPTSLQPWSRRSLRPYVSTTTGR